MLTLAKQMDGLANEARTLAAEARLIATVSHDYVPPLDAEACRAIIESDAPRTTKACALVRLWPAQIISLKQIRILVRQYGLSGFGTWAVWNLRNSGELKRIGRGVYEWTRT
jgi:hypothetical protein